MTADVLVIAPVLARPQNARPLVDSIDATAAAEWLLVFVCSATDELELEACLTLAQEHPRVGVTIIPSLPGPGDFALKTQAGYDGVAYQDVPLVLCAADDLRFHPGWDVAALAVFDEYDVGVVGTVDLGNRQTVAGTHATHPFVARCYIDRHGGAVGEPGTVYHQGYDHQYVDVELCQTAMSRGCYAHAHGSVIEHLHPLWRKGEQDATYRRGSSGALADRRLYERRRRLWESQAVMA